MFFATNSHIRYVSPSPSSALYPFSASFSAAAIRAKLSLAKFVCFWRMVIDSDLESLRGFQAQNMVSEFIQTGPYVETTVLYPLETLFGVPTYIVAKHVLVFGAWTAIFHLILTKVGDSLNKIG